MNETPDPRVRLAVERTLLAYERTQIAWVRTALALISFGFAIAKFFAYVRESRGENATVMSPHTVGLVMIVIGLVGLILGQLAASTRDKNIAQTLSRINRARCRFDVGHDRIARCASADRCLATLGFLALPYAG
jgi:uncharacterized membrane protein YidH (DUF202 family)